MTKTFFVPGQRWVSNTESELGLGIVVSFSNRRVELSFPAAGENRVYAVDNAPLSRVQYQVGERVRTEDGQSFLVDAVMEANGCLIYSVTDETKTAMVFPEQELNSFVQFSQPQERLFAGQIDQIQAFQLRCETLDHCRRLQQSSVKGLLGARVQLLPHQLYIASEIASRYAPRVLLADEVGLGKTIEAGLILHQQLITGRASRVLIVVPESLLHQWLVEMLRRFNLMFSIVDESRCQSEEATPEEDTETAIGGNTTKSSMDESESDPNPFESAQLILCTLGFLSDSPVRLAQAAAAGWDLLVVDEAHHLKWSEQSTSPSYDCIETLARTARGLLLLTATPEQLGVASHFARLRLLDPDRYHDLQAFIDEENKHQSVNALVQCLLEKPDPAEFLQQDLVQEQLRAYLGESALDSLLLPAKANDAAEFELALQAAVRALLDRHGTGRVLFRNTRSSVAGFPDRQLLRVPLPAPERYLQSYRGASLEQLLTPELLLGELWFAEDPRVSWLEEWLQLNRGKKVLVICARTQTAIDLEEHLRLRMGAFSTVFHEGMTLVARDRAAAYFADEEQGAQILICSEIGSEGRNFQFSHHLVLFDLPLNPDLLEQRIGRLDRIGQRNTVKIHSPHYAKTAQSVLLRWYQEGLDAIERICPAGQTLYDHFETELLRCLLHAEDEAAVENLVKDTRVKTVELLQSLQLGRDRLLELSSFDAHRADEIVGELVAEERRQELSGYMDQVLDQFGVEQEQHSINSLVLRPGQHMLEHTFPALPEDGMTATYHRELALSREDMHFLTWEHPLVTGAIDLVQNGEYGNTAFCTLKLPPTKPGTVLLEALFTLTSMAPKELQLQRYLPLTTVRLVVDSQGNDLSKLLSPPLLNKLAKKVPLQTAQELVRHTRPQITAMLGYAKSFAEIQRNEILDAALGRMLTAQKTELDRLQALATVNPNIRPEEIQHLEESAQQARTYLEAAQLRLDAVRVAMVRE